MTPAAGFVALAGIFALLVLLAGEQRLRRVCLAIGLRPPTLHTTLPLAVGIASLTILVALAAAQPVLATQQETRARADAEAYFVFDISRSMGARRGPHTPSRLERARSKAKEIRAHLSDIPVGVASLTDRLLPHLFASTSVNDFNAVIDRALGVDRPPARLPWGDTNGTKLAAVADLATSGYYSERARRRVLVIFTDGETMREGIPSLAAQMTQGRVRPFIVRFWNKDERIYGAGGSVNAAYSPDPASGAAIEQLAISLQTTVFEEGDAIRVVAAVRRATGEGPKTTRGRELQTTQLTPLVVALAFLPLLYILYRRNLPPVTAS